MTQKTVIAQPDGDSPHDEKYDLHEGTVTMSGTQVLARLPLEQRWRDQYAGLNTGGFISGYRGSPLGGYDQELWRIGARLLAANIHFQPGINEDLAATALWGSQYIGLYPGAKVDGVFGIWYGKSPGVDRSGDAFQHANTAGTSSNGGVIALVGDDHAAKSSSRAGQSDMQLKACGMPILYPSNVQEILDFGLHGIAMSRYSACWVAIKLVTDVLEVSSKVNVGNSQAVVNIPPLPTHAKGGLHIRANEPPLDMEARLYEHKLPAAIAYARANGLNKILLNPAQPKLGIISAGKSWGDVRGALATLNLDDEAAEGAGLRLLKIGMTWPLDPQILREFVSGLECVLVVEEKRPFLEEHIKAALYDAGATGRVRVVGKLQPAGMGGFDQGLLPMAGEMTPQIIAKAITQLANLQSTALAAVSMPGPGPGPVRLPNFCSGCPHNTSTVVPDGSRAMAGIGCHGMAMWIRAENTSTVTHMGAEGMFWVGQAPFTNEKHVFVNIGDGTFFHSGSLALRQAVAAKMRVTYKVLFNGYVSMTGGQPHDGDLTVQRVIDIVLAEGVGRVVVVTDDTEKYHNIKLPHNVPVRPRTELDAVQRELRDFIGVSVLVYDQVCATELRRQRKSNPTLDLPKRTIINPEVCEGCGDCSVKSNCMSLEPLETELGRKRRINQSSCNKDFSCVQGFCPSFVTVHGGQLKRPTREVSVAGTLDELPIPKLPPIGSGYNVLIAGIGGTGIVTVSSILAQAAQLDHLNASVLDLTGMAQKYGAVMSHLRFMPFNTMPSNSRLGIGEADLVIGCDLIVTAGQEALSKMCSGRTFVVVNTAVNPTSEFHKSPDWNPNVPHLLDGLKKHLKGEVDSLQASQIATALMGDAIAINLFLLGYVWQLGKVPIRLEALEKAINLQGVEVKFNLESFHWGRRMAKDPDVIKKIAAKAKDQQFTGLTLGPLQRVEEIVDDREHRLVNYQNAAYSKRYRKMIDEILKKDDALDAHGRLACAAARGYYKLLAYKDEYEVARLYSTPEFRQMIEAQFEGSYKLHFHIGVWPFGVQQKGTDVQTKREVGPWILTVMKVLQHFRWARGRWMDPFRNTKDRMLAKELIARYEEDLKLILNDVAESSLEAAVSLASLPEKIRGFGHVRFRHAHDAEQERAILRSALEN